MTLRRRTFLLSTAAATAPAAAASGERVEVKLSAEQVVEANLPWPYLTVLRDGTTIVLGHRGWPPGSKYPTHYIGVSRDGRKTWTEWRHDAARHGKGPVTEGTATELRDGRLLFFDVHAEHQGGKVFQHNFWSTRDGMRSVEGPFPYRFSLPEADVSGVDDRGEPVSRMYVRRSLIELENGDLLASAYGRFEADRMPVEYLGRMTKMRSVLLRSADQGKNWRYVSTISAEPVEQEGPAEPVLARLSRGPNKGRLLCLVRTGRENPIYQCHSDDEGKTWTAIRPIRWRYSKFGRERDICGADPDVVEMADGTLAMSYGHKPDFEDHGNFLAFSLDHGETWGNVVRLSSSVTMAYTGVRETAPGVLYVVYTVSPLVQSHGYRDARFTTVGRHVRVQRVAG